MSAYPALARGRERVEQPALPGFVAPFDAPAGTVEPQPNGNAKLLFNGARMGVYPNEQKAGVALRTFRNAGLCR